LRLPPLLRDPDTEQAFKGALRVLCRSRTAEAVAHRLSTLLVMDKGAVLDVGTHREFLERCPGCERLFRIQFAAG
jgi:ABC-type transport system involved in Fe-S cluster assembly fused permease/ATPase subunit